MKTPEPTSAGKKMSLCAFIACWQSVYWKLVRASLPFFFFFLPFLIFKLCYYYYLYYFGSSYFFLRFWSNSKVTTELAA